MAQEGSLGRDYLWNTLGSVMNAAASVVLLLVTTRVLGSYWGGVFSIAYAVGQQFQTLGAFEMRPMQSTDVEKEHTFSTYLASRILTTLCMVRVHCRICSAIDRHRRGVPADCAHCGA